MKQLECPRRTADPVAGEYGRHNYNTADSDDFKTIVSAERILLATGWSKPVELARVCDCLGLRNLDFADRLCGIVVDYLRVCADRGVTPDLDDAERLLSERAVTRSPGELRLILQEPVAPGDTFADLVQEVQRAADARTDELCNSLIRNGVRAFLHAFNCERCISCQRRQPPSKAKAPRPKHKRAQRIPTYV